MSFSEASLDRSFESLQITATAQVRRRLARYIEILEHWNRSMNLTALEGEALARRLVAEPLWVAQRLKPASGYLDIGSGNGSPAFPWLAACDFEYADLVESRRRRAVFLRQAARLLAFPAVRVHPVRFDDFRPSRPAAWVTLQGVRLTAELRDRIGAVLGGAKIVWLTRDRAPSYGRERVLEIPGSDRCARIIDA